ncbi:MAG: nucleotidyl transferase AbiEii/AbiGii toxin family protein [Anaerolineales bacterium]|nr:nucleotidyl transferase AbiEii/AbiGii toxin family protein [Anaerolineales bacterium]
MNTPIEKNLHWETISPAMHQVMNAFGRTKISDRFYLAGGTALALQIGHRRSLDLDFFSTTEDIPSIRQPLKDALAPFNPILADSSWGNLVFLVQGVRVGFYGYGYPLVAPFVLAESVRLASIEDIGLMKLDALLARASRKDFYDLYAICRQIPLKRLFNLATHKTEGVRDFEIQAVKRLVFFQHAEQEEPPVLLCEIPWNEVKDFFRQQAIELSKDWMT